MRPAEFRFDESEHPRDENGRFTNKEVLYESESGGSVVKNYKGTPKEERANFAALKTFADNGSKVVLLETKKGYKVRTADCTINGVEWEIKTNQTATISAIDNAVHSCNGQSKNLILNVTSSLSDEDVFTGIKGRIMRTNIENIVVERNGEIQARYKREDFV